MARTPVTFLQLTSTCSLVCVVVLLLLLQTSSCVAQSTSISSSIQPSFTSTQHSGASSTPQPGSVTSHIPGDDDSHDVDFNSPSSYLTQVTQTLSDLPDHAESSSATSSIVTPSLSDVMPLSLTVSQTEPVMSTVQQQLQPTSTSMPLDSLSSSTTNPEAMNSSTAISGSTTLAHNDTKSSPVDGSLTTSTLPPFGNVSCSGNNTGCPEYNGKVLLTLSTPAIIGIAVGAAVFVIVVVCLLLCLCRRRQTLSGSKADLSTYWDDNVTLSYINGHIDYPKDISDEMVSLDNDSFLNSLDSMSFSNMWATESAKHTNF